MMLGIVLVPRMAILVLVLVQVFVLMPCHGDASVLGMWRIAFRCWVPTATDAALLRVAVQHTG